MTDENTLFNHETIFENNEISVALEQDLDTGNFDFVFTNNATDDSSVKAFAVVEGKTDLPMMALIDVNEAYTCLSKIAPADLYEIAKKMESIAIMSMARFAIKNQN